MKALWNRSAALRITVLLGSIIILFVTLASVLQYRQTKTILFAQTQALLAADLDGYGALYQQRRIIALRQALEFRAATEPNAATLLLDKSGAKLAGTLDKWPDDLPAVGNGFSTKESQHFTLENQLYLGVARLLPGGFPFLIAHPLTNVQSTLGSLRNGIYWLVAALAALSAVAGFLVSRGLMFRIGALNALVDKVSKGDPLPDPKPATDELGQLETHVHQMLGRIETLMMATRRLSDSIAHELRTPLSRLQTRVSTMDGASEHTEEIRKDLRQTIHVFDSLLEISSAETQDGSAKGLDPVDLAGLVEEVSELYEPALEAAELGFRLEAKADLWILGDRNLIARLVSNLFDNALKYTSQGDEVSLLLNAETDDVILTFADTGPGLPKDIREKALGQFTRSEDHRHIAGTGLGLAMVQAIATRHGAKVTMQSPEKGFSIRIIWPKLPPD